MKLTVKVPVDRAQSDGAPSATEPKASDRGELDALNVAGIVALLLGSFGAAAAAGPLARGREG